jgi:ATP-dependent RNA helicase HelY
VLTSAQRGPFTHLTYVTPEGTVRRVHSTALDAVPQLLGSIDLPAPFAPKQPEFARAAAAELRALVGPSGGGDGRRPTTPRALVRRARKLERLLGDVAALERRADEGVTSLVRRFDEVLAVLEAWRYVSGWSLTDRGQALRRIYHECDLLVAEALQRGVFDGLPPADLAGVVSAVAFERRGPDDGAEPWYPTRRVRDRVERLEACWAELVALEERHGLPPTRPPDGGAVAMVQAWAAGGGLDEVIEDEAVSGGDFVRIARLVADLLGQLARAAPEAATREAAAAAGDALARGVVAASSL